MPNVKIFVDETLFPDRRKPLIGALESVRSMLCRELRVETAACQFAVVPVIAMADLPRANVELQILSRPERTREVLLGVCGHLRDMLESATQVSVAVRASALQAESYVVLR
ncbi:hypothetical protein [Antarcticirhabdus aurantiaca]|uniref:Uncharacterized protein n=1 Tax=Antarcticirhabdus aurantiaca TaxID=2606717 RepID=A0ACD4NPQ4_9HYPH|nr:hypothetical protein [Antarcticirhabdus aurantiaca]WAJ28884.1 hypothetical protein OXU80_01115 [Jeongeuplla avenae]